MSVLCNAKRNAVMWSLTFYQSTFKQVLSYILMNSSAFLYCVKRDAIPGRKSVVCLQQISAPLVDFIAIDVDKPIDFLLIELSITDYKDKESYSDERINHWKSLLLVAHFCNILFS